MKGQTRDGVKLRNIEETVNQIGDITTRKATNHILVLNYPGQISCPIAKSTHARKMLVPWLKKVTGYNPQKIYQSLQQGKWN